VLEHPEGSAGRTGRAPLGILGSVRVAGTAFSSQRTRSVGIWNAIWALLEPLLLFAPTPRLADRLVRRIAEEDDSLRAASHKHEIVRSAAAELVRDRDAKRAARRLAVLAPDAPELVAVALMAETLRSVLAR